MNPSALEQKIGQLFLLGFAGDTLTPEHPVATDIAEGNLGGVILFDRLLAEAKNTNNIINPHQIARLTADLQHLSGGNLLIAVDQEGGMVSRFKKERGFPVTSEAALLGRAPDLQLTRKSAQQTARMLKKAGVNFNLAPVIDLNVYNENPIIGRYGRSFSAEASTVASHAAIWIDEHRREGIQSCIKHFPGHGSSRSDSHRGFVDITTTWENDELEPYRLLINAGKAEAVMVGHLFNKKFDKVYPATLSRSTIQSLLRHSLNFAGMIVSDDMQMKAITDHYGLAEGCCRALDAGIDLLIIGNNLSHDPHILSKLKTAVLTAIDAEEVTEQRIEDAWNNIQNFKKSLAKHHATP